MDKIKYKFVLNDESKYKMMYTRYNESNYMYDFWLINIS